MQPIKRGIATDKRVESALLNFPHHYLRITLLNRPLILIAFTALLLFCSLSLSAARPIPAAPKIAATGYLLIDFDSGRALAEKSADQALEPASLTKIMTAYVVFREIAEGNITLKEEVLISEKAWRMVGSRMFIEVGKRVKVETLLRGLIIQSGNDASVALAEHIAGSESTFAQLMNNHATRLGMSNTNFVNSTGLPHKDHYTTARDIALVAAAAIREFPDFYKWYGEKSFLYNGIKQHNRNKLLWRDKSVDGMKTGHTEAAGYCLVASAKRDNMRLISVVLGTRSENARAQESQSLLNYGFRFFETHKLYSANEALSHARIWKGDKKALALGLTEDLYVTIPRHSYKNLDAQMVLEPKLLAPITKGSTLGHVSITLEGKSVAQVPLTALEKVAEGNLFQQLKDHVLLWLE
ncbi:MAG: D-alanyl-D-alanine carboxypeptidase [Candidatus Polarisedimenticolaceae bacterium]|nr:D-alanyl-D-alanine carboxypeptidase [Candidatus Polarisedimenticolaceae bacterium]